MLFGLWLQKCISGRTFVECASYIAASISNDKYTSVVNYAIIKPYI